MTEEENKINSKNKIRVGVLRGGNGEVFDFSMRIGGDTILFILNNFPDKFIPVDIFVDTEGLWHVQGFPAYVADLPHRVDIVWNTTHHTFSQILRNFNIPVVDAGHNSSFLGASEQILRNHIKNHGGNMPNSILLPAYQPDFDGELELYAQKKAKEVFHKFGAPWVVKSFTKDVGVGIHVAKTYPELIEAIIDIVKHGASSILIEELVLGKAVSVHSLKDFRNEEIYNFPLLDTKTDHLFALNHFSDEEKQKLFNFTKNLHKSLIETHYMKTDFVIKPNGKIFVSQASFSPDLRENSHLAKSTVAVGSKIHSIFEHIIESALK